MSLPKDEPILADSPQENNKSFTLGLPSAPGQVQQSDGVRPLKHLTAEQVLRSRASRAIGDWRRSRTAVRKRFNRLHQSANAGKPQPSSDSREERQNTKESTWQR